MTKYSISYLNTTGKVVKNITNSSGAINYINLQVIPPTTPVIGLNTDSVTYAYVTLFTESQSGSFPVSSYEIYRNTGSGYVSQGSYIVSQFPVYFPAVNAGVTDLYYVVASDSNSNKSNNSNIVSYYAYNLISTLNSLTITTTRLNYNITVAAKSSPGNLNFTIENTTRGNGAHYFQILASSGNNEYSGQVEMVNSNQTGDSFTLDVDQGIMVIDGTQTLPFVSA